MRHIRYGHEVTAARWDAERAAVADRDERRRSHRRHARGRRRAAERPELPDIEGIDSFEGTIFHSARWDHEHALDGERVAVDRHRRLLDPARSPRSSRGWRSCTSSSARRRGSCRTATGRPRAASATLFRTVPAAQRLVRGAVYCARELFVLPFMRPREGSLPERDGAQAPGASRCPTRRCARG